MNITNIKVDILVMFHVMGKVQGKVFNLNKILTVMTVEYDDVEGFEELKGVEEGTELIEDQAALDQ